MSAQDKMPWNPTLQEKIAFASEVQKEGKNVGEELEKKLQQSLMQGNALPVDIRNVEVTQKVGRTVWDGATLLEGFGVRLYKETVIGDPIFRYAELPQGWKIVPGNEYDARVSNLIDRKGFVRAIIWFDGKTGRESHLRVVRSAFEIIVPRNLSQDEYACAIVHGGKDVVYTTEVVKLPEGKDREKVMKKWDRAARAWLKKHYPEHDNPTMYWD